MDNRRWFDRQKLTLSVTFGTGLTGAPLISWAGTHIGYGLMFVASAMAFYLFWDLLIQFSDKN